MTALDLKWFDPNLEYGGYWVGKGVEEGMAPFRLKMISIYCDYDINFYRYRIVADAVLWNGYTISFAETIDVPRLADYPEREFLRVTENLRDKFRYERLHFPSPNNITLGEN